MNPMKKQILFSLVLVTLIAQGCAYTRFARVQNPEGGVSVGEEDVRIYLNNKPTGNYTEVGIIEGHFGWFTTRSGMFKKMRKRAAKEGAQGIVNIRSKQRINVDVDLKDKSVSAFPKTVYYGDAIVYLAGEPSERTAGTSTTDQLMNEPPHVRADRDGFSFEIPTN